MFENWRNLRRKRTAGLETWVSKRSWIELIRKQTIARPANVRAASADTAPGAPKDVAATGTGR